MSRARYVEVCAGAGGWSIGLHAAGWAGTGLELDADASETHRRHVGPCITADVTTAPSPHPADLVCGGVPCQSFSLAGDRGGLDDPRGQLFRALLRHADEAGARVCALENVRGLISCGALPVILDAFRAHGYEPLHTLLNACDYGVPQNRVRLFVVGFRDASDRARFRWPQPTHGAPGNIIGLPPWRTVREALGLAGDFARDGGGRSSSWQGMRTIDVDAHGYTIPGHSGQDLLSRPSPCVTASEYKSANAFGSRGAITSPPRAGDVLNPALSRGALANNLAAAGLLDRVATTIDGTGCASKAGHHESHKTGAVRLTVRDCARLQAFPDSVEFVGNVRSQFRQVGNAVPPPLGEAIAHAVWTALYGSA